jgi:proline iminopeptidase
MRSWPSGLRGCHPPIPRVQQLYGVHARLVRFYDPENASRVPSEPGSKNAALYPVFVGDDVEFFIGGEVARLPDFRPRLGALRMPTLILAGRYDRALCPRYQLDFVRCAPQAEFHWMERSGTFSHIEEADSVMALLRSFFVDSRSTTVDSDREVGRFNTLVPGAARST